MPFQPLEISSPDLISIQSTLRILSIPVHRKGYRHLTIAISCYTRDNTQSITKELYPAVAKISGLQDWRLVERDIRAAIQYAWTHRDPHTWEVYFSGVDKAPSNKVFITVISDLLQ